MKISVRFISLATFAVLSCVAQASDESKAVVNLRIAVDPTSTWTKSIILEKVKTSNQIFSHCGLEFRVAAIDFNVPEQMGVGYESVPLARAYAPIETLPIAFFVKKSDYNMSAGFSPGPSFLFISSYALTKSYIEKRAEDYEILAHELGHLLGLNHISGQSNLMSGYVNDLSSKLTTKQCAEVMKSSHVIVR